MANNTKDDDNDNSINIVIAQIISSVCLSLVPIFLGLFPRYLYYKNGGESPNWAGSRLYNLCLTILSCFGGGIVLSSALLHMLPDVRAGMLKEFEDYEFSLLDISFLPEFLVLVGLATIYIVEEIAHLIMADDGEKLFKEPEQGSEESGDLLSNLEEVARNTSIAHGIPVREIIPHNFGTTSRSQSIVDPNSPHLLYLRSIENLHRGSVIKSGEQSSASANSTPPHSRANSLTVNHISSNRLRNSLLFNIAENDLRRKVEEALSKIPNNNQPIIVNTNNTHLNTMPSGEANNNNPTTFNQKIVNEQSNICSTTELVEGKKKERNHEEILKALLALVALSVQSFMEGIAIGVQSSDQTVYMLFGTVAAHKFVVSFMMGMEMSEARAKMRTFIFSMLFFSIVSPIGILIGIILTPGNSKDKAKDVIILEGLACGTLLFVVFFEIFQRERERKAMSFQESKFIGFIQIFSIIAGLGVMVWLINIVDGSH